MVEHQVIGVIHIDPDSYTHDLEDGSVCETLLRLRCTGNAAGLEAVPWEIASLAATEESVVSVTLEANLHQLQAELEGELVEFLERLAAV